MAGGSAARANKQRKGGKKDLKKNAKKAANKKSGKAGGAYRGLEILYNPETGEVVTLNKKESKKIKEQHAAQRKWKRTVIGTAKPKTDLVQLRMKPSMYNRLKDLLAKYREARKVLERDLEGVSSGSDSSLMDSEDDEEEEDSESESEDEDASSGTEDLVRTLNDPEFYSGGRIDDGGDDDDDDEFTRQADLLSDGSGSSDSDSIFDGEDEEDTIPPSRFMREDSIRALNVTLPSPDIPVDPTHRIWLESLGIATPYATAALQLSKNDDFHALAYLYSKASGKAFTDPSEDILSDPYVIADSAKTRREELDAMSSIFGEHFAHYTRKDGSHIWQISDLVMETPDNCGFVDNTTKVNIQMLHPPRSIYPFETPIIVVQPADKSSRKKSNRAAMLSLAVYLQRLANDHLGECLVDLLVSALFTAEARTSLSDVTTAVAELVRCWATAEVSRTTRARVMTIIPPSENTSSESINKPPAEESNGNGFNMWDSETVAILKPEKKEKPKPKNLFKLKRGPGGGVPTFDMLDDSVEVAVTLKEDQGTERLVTGLISEVLTSGDHPRGIKVRLTNGQVGRVQAILEREVPLAEQGGSQDRKPLRPSSRTKESSSTPSTPKSKPSAVDQLVTPMKTISISSSTPPSTPPVLRSSPPKSSARKRPTLSQDESTRVSKDLKAKFEEQQNRPKYKSMKAQRESLPAWEWRDTVLDAIDGNQVVVVEGDTGCGKTTQVPQFILDRYLTQGRGAECRMLVTQPRRISAIGVAERVASERDETLGKTVGYQIRLESRMSEETRILFATTGILLRRMEGAGVEALTNSG